MVTNEILERRFSFLGNSNTTEYSYDALGRRVSKNVQTREDKKGESFSQAYLYLADEDKILLGRDGHGKITLYVDGQGIDEHLGEATKEKAKSYITDHLGSVLNTEASDNRKMFGAFGDSFDSKNYHENFEIKKNSTPVIYGFAGRQLDQESGLYYNRARMYNADMGKFASKDPMGLKAGDVNLYRYVGNNPQKFVDPSGRCTEYVVVAIVIAVAAYKLYRANKEEIDKKISPVNDEKGDESPRRDSNGNKRDEFDRIYDGAGN
jgi:RHS repeat-associated protein